MEKIYEGKSLPTDPSGGLSDCNPFVARFILHPASYREQHQVVDRVKTRGE